MTTGMNWLDLENLLKCDQLDRYRDYAQKYPLRQYMPEVLGRAVRARAIKIVTFLTTEERIDPWKKGLEKQLPIFYAVINRDQTMIKYFLGRCPREINEVLIVCLQSGNLDMFKFVIDQGGDINHIRYPDGVSLVAIAVEARQSALVKYLINLKADVCQKGQFGQTPLTLAVKNQDFDMVKYLIENGAGPTIQSAFLTAIEIKDLKIVKHLKEAGAFVNHTYKNGTTPLVKALEMGDIDITNFLLECGADRNIEESVLTTCIMVNVRSGNLDYLKLLPSFGANFNAKSTNGDTPLTLSASLRKFILVQYLVEEAKVDIDLPNAHEQSALKIAASNKYFDITKYLIDNGANVELAKAELDSFANWNEDFDFYLKYITKKTIEVPDNQAAKMA